MPQLQHSIIFTVEILSALQKPKKLPSSANLWYSMPALAAESSLFTDFFNFLVHIFYHLKNYNQKYTAIGIMHSSNGKTDFFHFCYLYCSVFLVYLTNTI